jgi:hypothetical protein
VSWKNLNSWLFQLILKSNSKILTKKNIALAKYCNNALSFYRNIACENRPSDEGLKERKRRAGTFPCVKPLAY